jgi:hypothetical protein
MKSGKKKKNYYVVGPPADATTIAGILPKLRPDQRLWVDDLSPDERETLEDLLQTSGEAYFFEIYGSLVRDLEYVRTL